MEEYNGYPNYETWVMSLWIDNNESDYDYARELARDVRGSGYERVKLGDALKGWQEESMPLVEDANVFADLLLHSFGRVDWVHIAGNLLDEEP